MIHLTKSLGFTCNMLLSFTFSSFFFFLKINTVTTPQNIFVGKKVHTPF